MALSLRKTFRLILNTKNSKQSFENLFNFVNDNLQYIGLDFARDDWHQNLRDKFKSSILLVPVFMFYVLNLNAIMNFSSTEGLVFAVFGVSAGLITVPKSIAILVYYEKLKLLTKTAVHGTKYSYTGEKYEDDLRTFYTTIASFVTKIITVCFMLSGFSCNFIPMFIPNQWILPLSVKIPGISNDSHPGYEIHYLLVFCLVTYNSFILLGFDLLFYYLSIFITFRLDVCKHLAKDIGDYAVVADQHGLMVNVINLHVETYRFIKTFSDTISNVILFESSGSLIMITVCLYTSLINPYALWIQLCFFVILTQFFIYCFFGQLIVTKVEEVSKALYCNKWYNFNDSARKKQLLFMLKVSQQKVTLNAYGLISLSYETFTQVCKAALGYYTFLKNVF